MAELKQLLQNLSLVLIVSAVLESILPPSGGKRAFHLLCGVVIFAAVASSIKGLNLQTFHADEILLSAPDTSQQMESRQNSALLLAAESGCASAAKDALEKARIPFSEIHAACEMNGGSVQLRKLTVSGTKTADRTAAHEVLAPLCENAQIVFVPEEMP